MPSDYQSIGERPPGYYQPNAGYRGASERDALNGSGGKRQMTAYSWIVIVIVIIGFPLLFEASAHLVNQCPLSYDSRARKRDEWQKEAAAQVRLRHEWQREKIDQDNLRLEWLVEGKHHEEQIKQRRQREEKHEEDMRQEWLLEEKHHEEQVKQRRQLEEEYEENVRQEWLLEEKHHDEWIKQRRQQEEEYEENMRQEWLLEEKHHEERIKQRRQQEEEYEENMRQEWKRELEKYLKQQAEERHKWEIEEENHWREVEQQRLEWQREEEAQKHKMDRQREEWKQEGKEHDRSERERRKQEKRERQKMNMFWDRVEARHCTTYATREYTALLRNLPADYPYRVEACKEIPLDVHGVSYLPKSCEDQGPNAVIGRWEINNNEPDCVTFWAWFKDKGCTAERSGKRRFEHYLENLPEGSDWREFCATTPAGFHGMHFPGAQICFQHNLGTYGHWEIEDNDC